MKNFRRCSSKGVLTEIEMTVHYRNMLGNNWISRFIRLVCDITANRLEEANRRDVPEHVVHQADEDWSGGVACLIDDVEIHSKFVDGVA